LAGDKSFKLQVHHPVSVMETQMTVLLVMVMVSAFLSIPAWSVGLTLAEWVHLSQILYFPPIHSTGVDFLDSRIIDVFS
jgi:hypothetical protein